MSPRCDGRGASRPDLRRALIALCITEITSWGVLYYAFPVIVTRLTAITGWSIGLATAACSTGLVVSALAGIPGEAARTPWTSCRSDNRIGRGCCCTHGRGGGPEPAPVDR